VDELRRLALLVARTDADVTIARSPNTSLLDSVPPGTWGVLIDVPEEGTCQGFSEDLVAAIDEALMEAGA
jgi:hypothetical protein